MPTRTVVHLLNAEVFGGVEQFVIFICRHHDKSRYRPHIIALHEGQFTTRVRELGIDVDVLSMTSRWDLRVVPKIRKILRRANADIVHAHTIRTQLVGSLAARKLDVPFLIHIHSPSVQEGERAFKNRWNSFLEARLQRWTDRYIIVAESLRKYLIQNGIPDRKIVTLLNAIDVNRVLEASRGMKPTAHEVLHLDTTIRLIGMVALFRYRKGAQDLLQTVKILGEGPMPYRVVMIGDGEKLPRGGNYLDVLKKMAADLGIEEQVIFIGHQVNPQQWIAALDILLLPSRFGEGLPNVVQEAMALETPVIATPNEGTAEVVTNRETGLLVPVENPEALAGAISELLANPELREKLTINAARLVRERFDAPIHARKLMDIYDELLEN
jgi:glycosyltransferase involved in cell wall biosynthesis